MRGHLLLSFPYYEPWNVVVLGETLEMPGQLLDYPVVTQPSCYGIKSGKGALKFL